MMRVKNYLKIICLLIMLFFNFININATVTQENIKTDSSVTNLKPNKEYKINLDQKGKKEKFTFSMSKSGIFKIKVNQKVLKKLKFNDEYYNPGIQILDIDESDNKLDLWVYSYAYSEDIGYSALYQYDNGKLKKIWSPADSNSSGYGDAYRICNGFITSTNGKGQFTMAMDRAVNSYIIGNHIDKVVFQLNNGKVKQLTDHTFYFYKTYGERINAKDKGLRAKNKMILYKSPSTTSGTFMIRKNTKCYPKKMYIDSNLKIYIMVKLENGKKGWIYAEDYSYYNLPFRAISAFD